MNTPPIKMCGVFFLKDGSVLVQGEDYEPTGPGGLASTIITRISQDAVHSLLSVVVLHTLNQTRIVEGRTYQEKNVSSMLWALSGVRSYRALESNADYLSITMKDDLIEVTPTEKTGGRGFSHLPELKSSCHPDESALCALLIGKIETVRKTS